MSQHTRIITEQNLVVQNKIQMPLPSRLRVDQLSVLHSVIDACRQCEAAGNQIIKPTLMERGSGQSVIMAVGIAPGKSAINAQKAFAGNSARRLMNWLSAAGFDLSEDEFRNSFYLTSLNKCAAPTDTTKNRQHLWGRCAPFLWQQIDLIQPRLILLLGKEPADMLIGRKPIEWNEILGECWSTDKIFAGELFKPIMTNTNWLFMPHPSGLSRTMNDVATASMVIKALKEALTIAHFSPKKGCE